MLHQKINQCFGNCAFLIIYLTLSLTIETMELLHVKCAAAAKMSAGRPLTGELNLITG